MKILEEKNYLRYRDLDVGMKFMDGNYICTVKKVFPERDGGANILLVVDGKESSILVNGDEMSEIAGEEVR